MKTILLFCSLLFGLILTTAAQTSIDITGTWIVQVETDMGSGTPTFVLKQEGEKITGTYTGTFGTSEVTGTLKGEVLHLEISIDGNTLRYDGTASATELKGKVDLAGMATGTFVGKKK